VHSIDAEDMLADAYHGTAVTRAYKAIYWLLYRTVVFREVGVLC
jgi:hypothetical protein